jgi:hypothetical protein
MGRKIWYMGAVILLLAVASCKRDIYKINISGSEVEVKVTRLEKDLFTISPGRLQDSTLWLRKKYGSFLRYFSYVINIGEMTDSAWSSRLLGFCTDKLNNEVYGSVEAVYPTMESIERELSSLFSHYRYYFPSKPVPSVYTCITGFNNSLITVKDTLLGIGLDRYLGSESKYYQQLGLYKYQVARMNPSNIIPDCAYGWATAEWNYSDAGYEAENVLSSILHEGKLLYFAKCMLPEYKDELIFGFTQAQVKFCRQNEGRMWQYIVENNLLFKTEQLTIKKLIGDAPFTSYFSSDSPGRAAAWIGFRIVESYMKKNRDVTLEDLMKQTDLQSILEKAKYHPPAG